MTAPNKMRHALLAIFTAMGVVTFATQSQAQGSMGKGGMSKDGMGKMEMNQPMMDKMMASWPMASKEAAMFMMKKYGAPAAMTSEMAMWGKTGPWKRTVVYSHEYPHDFPVHHTDVMQQWLDYKAPPSMYDDLAMYDGSVVLERTVGEISARCDKEAANFLALNLANEIITGKQTIDGARKMYLDQVMKLKASQPAPYTEKLMFGMMSNTNDPDHPPMP